MESGHRNERGVVSLWGGGQFSRILLSQCMWYIAWCVAFGVSGLLYVLNSYLFFIIHQNNAFEEIFIHFSNHKGL